MMTRRDAISEVFGTKLFNVETMRERLPRHEEPDDGKNRAAENAQTNRRVNRLSRALHVARAEQSRHENVCADRKPDEKRDGEVDQHVRRTDGGKRMFAREVSDNHEVGGGEKRLQQTRGGERNRHREESR